MLKNVNIGKKLIITFMFVAILSSIAGIVGFCVETTMNSSYNNALHNYGFAQGDVGLFATEFNRSRVITSDIVIDTDTQKMQANSDVLDKSIIQINTYFANIKKVLITEKEIGYYNDINSNLSKYETMNAQVVDLAKQNKKAEAHAISTQALPIAQAIRTSTNALINEKTTIGNQLAASLSSQGAAANIVILVVILFSLIVSLFIAITIARSISKPVKEMADAAQRLAEGDLSVQVNVDSKNEIGQLGESLSKTFTILRAYIDDIKIGVGDLAQGNLNITPGMEFKGDFIELRDSILNIAVSLNDTLSQINQASAQVSSGSEQVSDGAQALAQGATEQASAIEELSASITEISAHVRDNAEHAVNANVNVNRVSSEIEISNKQMSAMITAMAQINDSSSQIGKIIKTIEDIAFQTNILALNAAVEAARAGSAGKGFAVVADEVRNLASKSAEAAKDTTILIENSMKQVESGTKIAAETAKSLLKVVESTRIVSDTVEKISKASNSQSDAISQVTQGIDQISNVVQTNSATAEESAAASAELAGQAQTLKELTKKFKLRGQNGQDNQTQNVQPEPQKLNPHETYLGSSKY